MAKTIITQQIDVFDQHIVIKEQVLKDNIQDKAALTSFQKIKIFCTKARNFLIHLYFYYYFYARQLDIIIFSIIYEDYFVK